MTTDTGTVQLIPVDLGGLPPSSKLVYMALDELGPATRQEIQDATTLPRRTVEEALRQLRNRGTVNMQANSSQAGKPQYTICGDSDNS